VEFEPFEERVGFENIRPRAGSGITVANSTASKNAESFAKFCSIDVHPGFVQR
jgi:hypothetical protein